MQLFRHVSKSMLMTLSRLSREASVQDAETASRASRNSISGSSFGESPNHFGKLCFHNVKFQSTFMCSENWQGQILKKTGSEKT